VEPTSLAAIIKLESLYNPLDLDLLNRLSTEAERSKQSSIGAALESLKEELST
jgi:hypothetical protein